MSVTEEVERRLADDETLAKGIAEEIRQDPPTPARRTIRRFFRELDSWPTGWPSNRPAGLDLPQLLLVMPPMVLDLEPLPEPVFKRVHRVGVRTIEALVDLGCLVPNLYARNPAEWRDAPHDVSYLEGLVKKSLVNGIRVDEYFRLQDPLFPDHQTRRRNQLLDAITALETDDAEQFQFLTQDSPRPKETLHIPLGGRWAYLDVVAPRASQHIQGLVESGNVREAIAFIRARKHWYVSPISASIGGNFVWGPREISRVTAANLPSAIVSRETRYLRRPEYLEFLLSAITEATPFQVLHEVAEDKLITLLRESDLLALKRTLFQILDTMTRLARGGEIINDRDVSEWKRLTREIRKTLDRFNSECRAASVLLTAAALSVGFFCCRRNSAWAHRSRRPS